MSRARTPPDRRLPPRSRGGRFVALALLLPTLLVGACGVARPPPERLPAPATLPNLRRASQAQLDRIALEAAHVQALTERLNALRAQEDRLHGQVLSAERSYQRLQADYDGVQVDVAAVAGELALVRTSLAEHQAELERLQGLVEQTRGEAERARTEVEALTAAEAAASGGAETQEGASSGEPEPEAGADSSAPSPDAPPG